MARISKNVKKRIVALALITVLLCLNGCGSVTMKDFSYPFVNDTKTQYSSDIISTESTFSKDLCVIDSKDTGENKLNLSASGQLLIDLTKNKCLYKYNPYTKISADSITAIAIYYTIKQENMMDNEVVVSSDANATAFQGKTVCGLSEGDVITMDTLMTSYLLSGGDDAVTAIALSCSKNEKTFVKLMNAAMKKIGALNTHFTSIYSTSDAKNITTLYDVYLLFNALSSDEAFLSIAQMKSYTAKFTDTLGNELTKVYESNGQFTKGTYILSKGFSLLSENVSSLYATDNYLFLLVKTSKEHIYFVALAKASSQYALYAQMNQLLASK